MRKKENIVIIKQYREFQKASNINTIWLYTKNNEYYIQNKIIQMKKDQFSFLYELLLSYNIYFFIYILY